jgi:FAD/FMN-containing dehydrogenase
MKTEHTTVRNWGNYPSALARIHTPANTAELSALFQTPGPLLARGNGRCYGDAALADVLVSTLELNRILDFDAQAGRIRCEAGVLLADVIRHVVPQGWFFHVTPGIKNITVGGAIACDVHGKNHPAKGCFSQWLESFVLLRADGQPVTCSKTQHADLFWQTCGGMGWTGIVQEATFQLMPIQSVWMRQTAVRAPHFEALFRAFEAHTDRTYAAGWIDCTAAGKAFGRGVAFFAEHSEVADQQPLAYPDKQSLNVPFFAPSWVLNPLSIRLHNYFLFSKAHTGERVVDMDTYFYPLDRIHHWNRLYGRRGFIQYQFCLPQGTAFDGIRRVMELIADSRETPFLTVLKRHGARPEEAVHSFPIKGYSLALDFPRTSSIFGLVARLDALIWDLGGKIYLAKDACSAARMGRVDPREFGEGRFGSLLRGRVIRV